MEACSTDNGPEAMAEEPRYREEEWEWLVKHFKSDNDKRQSDANKKNRGCMTQHHHYGARPFSEIYKTKVLKGHKMPVVSVTEDVYHDAPTKIAKLKEVYK